MTVLLLKKQFVIFKTSILIALIPVFLLKKTYFSGKNETYDKHVKNSKKFISFF